MPTAAVTTVNREVTAGPLRAVFATYTFSSSYTTGGEVLDPAKFGLNVIEGVIPVSVWPLSTDAVQWTPTKRALQLFTVAGAVTGATATITGTEVSAASDNKAISADIIVFGT